MLLCMEIFVAYLVISFLVFFLSTTASFKAAPNFNIEDVVEISNIRYSDTLKRNIGAIKEVQLVSVTDYQPYYTFPTHNTLHYFDKHIGVYKWAADENLQQTLKLTIESGRWFLPADRGLVPRPLIINSTLKNHLFSGLSAEGKIIKIDSADFQIVGVAKDLNDPSAVYLDQPHVFVLDTGDLMLVKLKQPFSENIYNKLRAAIPTIRGEFQQDFIYPVEQSKRKKTSRNNIMMGALAGLSGFLIINVILGLFSMLYQNISRRKAELGVRRASGATAFQIYKQIIYETIALSTIALIPGAIVAYQFMLFQVFDESNYYTSSMIIGAAIVYFLAVACALYPAHLASRVQPATALHEE